MLTATFIIKRRLKMARKNIPEQVWEVVKPKREVFNPQIQKSFIVALTRLGRFHIEGKEKMGGSYFANPAQTASTPASTQFTTVSVIKSRNCSQILALSSRMGRGNSESWGAFKVSFERFKKPIDPNALLNNLHKVYLR